MSTASVGPLPVGSVTWLRPAAWLSLAFGSLANLLFLIGDPYWLSLPSCAAALVIGYAAIRRGGRQQYAASHVGVNLALLALLLWLIIDFAIGWMMSVEVSLLR